MREGSAKEGEYPWGERIVQESSAHKVLESADRQRYSNRCHTNPLNLHPRNTTELRAIRPIAVI